MDWSWAWISYYNQNPKNSIRKPAALFHEGVAGFRMESVGIPLFTNNHSTCIMGKVRLL